MPTKEQEDFGHEVIKAAKDAVREIGWEDAAFASMMTLITTAATFTRRIPRKGAPGQTIVTDDKFQEDFQEFIQTLALMAAVLAEKTGQDLTKPPVGPN